MDWRGKGALGAGAVVAACLALGPWSTTAQTPGGNAPRPVVNGSRFEFEVIESTDAKYLGDTPAHVGRNGGLEGQRPRVALGDPVFRENTQIGHVTALTWERTKGALSVEFDPEPFQRVAVGDVVWVALDGPQGAKKPAR